MHKILPQIYTTPNCRCGLSRETVKHFLVECPLHTSPCTSLCDSVELTSIKNNVAFNKRLINMQVLIGDAEYLPAAVKTKVCALVGNSRRSASQGRLKMSQTDQEGLLVGHSGLT